MPNPPWNNLLRDLPRGPDEVFSDLLKTSSFRLERIVSRGQATPPGEWLSQPASEWVLVLTGRARLMFADPAEGREMGAGDCVLIPAGTRHRVEWTDPYQETVWLALHF